MILIFKNKVSFIFLFFCCSILVRPVLAENSRLVWGGGSKSSSIYSEKYVPKIIEGLSELRLSGYQWGGKSSGTLQNIEKVRVNPTNLAVGQLDLIENKSGITILHRNIGPECLYMITKEKGFENLGHVLGNSWDLSIITGNEKSGSLGTWKILTEIYPKLTDLRVVKADGIDEIVTRTLSSENPAVGFFVMRPDPNSKVFQKIEEKNLIYIPIVDFELENRYKFYNLKVSRTGVLGFGRYVQTACTSVALFTGILSEQVAGRERRRLEETIKRVTAAKPELFRPSTKDFIDTLRSMSDMASEKAKELGKQMRQT